ncbi:MAG: TIM barrel protein [Prevotella sp.]|nr:TIM barrel protein [Prevotella sp.]
MNKTMVRTCLAVCAMVFLSAYPAGALAQQRYRVAACDWMMLKRQKLGEFQLARDIKADGVEMDMGPLGQRPMFDNKLRDDHFRQLFRRTADSLQIAVPSLAMSGFFAQSFLKRDNYKELIADCLQSMDVMGATVAFLPLGGCGNEWQQAGAQHDEMVSRLHAVGEMARRAKKVIAIRTALPAAESLRLLKEIHSKGIKIYYNLQDAVDQHRNPCDELRLLGRKNVAQIHASLTDSVTLDRDPRIDMRQVRQTLDGMKWSGWLVVERSRNAKDVRNVKANFGTNVAYLKEIFQGDR